MENCNSFFYLSFMKGSLLSMKFIKPYPNESYVHFLLVKKYRALKTAAFSGNLCLLMSVLLNKKFQQLPHDVGI